MKQEQQIFKTYKELSREIHKRDYENIKGLKAEITAKEYDYFLNVLPPLNWKESEEESESQDESFILSECLSGKLYLKFFYCDKGLNHYCEVVEYDLNDEEMD